MTLSLTLRIAIALVAVSGAESYKLSREYRREDFINKFNFWDDAVSQDPTSSQSAPSAAWYMPRSAAQSQGLVWVNAQGRFGLSVDSTVTYGGNGRRPSVRISSQEPIHYGLLILDAVHVPYGQATWPAFWLSGADGKWPYSGEIDIIEGIGDNVQNTVSYHTGPGKCSYDLGVSQSGQFHRNFGTDCNALAHSDSACGVTDPSPSSYGRGADNVGGGVWALEWTSSSIKTWHFNRNNIPRDIINGKPVPNSWGEPVTNLASTKCDINSAFGPQSIVFNIELCGTWQGSVFNGGPQACFKYVQQNPHAFRTAYFEINYLRYYQ